MYLPAGIADRYADQDCAGMHGLFLARNDRLFVKTNTVPLTIRARADAVAESRFASVREKLFYLLLYAAHVAFSSEREAVGRFVSPDKFAVTDKVCNAAHRSACK